MVPALLAGCESNPVVPTDEHEDATADLSVDLTLSSSHVHILSELTFTVVVTDHHGDRVTDFDTLRVERRDVDTETWRAIDLTLGGTSYVGTYTFTSSGDYEIRVVGRRPHDTAMVHMHTMAELLQAVPAHAEAGGYRVEFETFPGHLHQHNTATARFWVMEVERDAQGVRPPITGLTAEIHCLEADGSTETHQASETSSGVYEADHTFDSVGDFVFELHFTGSDNNPAEVPFTVNVVPAH
jgi:hypothetical protein